MTEKGISVLESSEKVLNYFKNKRGKGVLADRKLPRFSVIGAVKAINYILD